MSEINDAPADAVDLARRDDAGEQLPPTALAAKAPRQIEDRPVSDSPQRRRMIRKAKRSWVLLYGLIALFLALTAAVAVVAVQKGVIDIGISDK